MARRIALTIAVVPLIVLVGLRSAWAAYACSMDGQIRDACCCPKKDDAKHSPDGAPRITAPDCCDVAVGQTPEGPEAREADRLRSLDAPLNAIVPAAFNAPLRSDLTRPRAKLARPPPRAIPTYLANRTILR